MSTHERAQNDDPMSRVLDMMMSRRAVIGAGTSAVVAGLYPSSLLAQDVSVGVGGATALAVRRMLANAPYTAIGRGEPIYVVASALCPYCLQMFRRFPGAVPGLEVRYIAYPLSFAESGQVFRVWRDRSATTWQAYMQRRLAGIPHMNHPSAYNQSARTLYDNNIDNIDAVREMFKRAYPRQSFTGTPAFFVNEGDEIVHLGGDQMQFVADVVASRNG